MRKYMLFFAFICLLANAKTTLAQQKDEPLVTIDIHGFVAAQAFYDTRQIVEAREGMVSLYPLRPELDANGEDINARGSFNLLSMTTRVGLAATGREIFNARPYAYVEGDFTGSSNIETNAFRLREAYISLKWKKTSVLFGQTWHPINAIDCRPTLLALNLGSPINSFGRSNQLKFEYKTKRFGIEASLLGQRDYLSSGPDGNKSSYIRNAIVPNLNLMLRYYGQNILIGGGIDYKTLSPELYHDFEGEKYINNNTVNGLSATAFAKYFDRKWEIKGGATYGQNLSELLLLGGYFVSEIDSVAHKITYSTTENIAYWAQFIRKYKMWHFSIYGGYTENLPYKDERVGESYGRGLDIQNLYRISPQVFYMKNALQLGIQYELTATCYGNADNKGKFSDTETATNHRILFSATYFF